MQLCAIIVVDVAVVVAVGCHSLIGGHFIVFVNACWCHVYICVLIVALLMCLVNVVFVVGGCCGCLSLFVLRVCDC